MGLNIFDRDEVVGSATQTFASDIVGSFRAGYLDNGRPQGLDAWRVTTGDPDVADAIAALLGTNEDFGGDQPREWETKGEEGLEVFTEANSVLIVLEDAKAVRQRFVQRSRNGEIVYTSDGAVKDDGTPDPHANLPLEDRLKLASDGLGPVLETTITFRLDDEVGMVEIGGDQISAADLGKFRYQSTGKSIGKAVLRDDIEGKLAEAGGPVRARLAIEHVAFTAKTGPRAGKLVEYNTATLKLLGPVNK